MKWYSKILVVCGSLAVAYRMTWAVADRHQEPETIDDDNPYLAGDYEPNDSQMGESGMYESTVKPFLDKILSFYGAGYTEPLDCNSRHSCLC